MILTEDELGRVQGLLDHLGYDLEPSILIGGWATQMRVGGDVSRDIDLIIMDPQLRQKLRDVLPDYSENTIHSGGRKGRGTNSLIDAIPKVSLPARQAPHCLLEPSRGCGSHHDESQPPLRFSEFVGRLLDLWQLRCGYGYARRCYSDRSNG